MPTFKIDIYNLIAMGGRLRRDGDQEWSESDLRIAGYHFKFHFRGPYREINKKEHEGRCVCATEAIVDADDPHALQLVVDDICWLLSLGHSSAVAAPACWGDNSKFPVWLRTTNADYHNFRPTISPLEGDALMRLVEKTWAKYQELKESRTLRAAIDYCVKSQSLGNTRELGLIIVFVLLEHLKHSFAVSKGFERAGVLWKDPRSGTTYNFKNLLELMFREVGMSLQDGALDDIVKLRNEIIHSGLSAWSDAEQRATFDLCENLCREYLLRLLGFKGDYQPYEGGCSMAHIE